MTIAATIIIPTFNHAQLIKYAIDSACKQTIKNIEIFVIGDGAPEITRDIVEKIAAIDNRVTYFQFPKDKRHGEIYRHQIIKEHSKGNIICYLSDDDLWLPHHVEIMQGLLSHADFAHTLPLLHDTQQWRTHLIDLSYPVYRNHILTIGNRIPLPNSGHTRAMYERLPFGWRTTPSGIPTDLYMFRQILSQPWVTAKSSFEATVMHFPSPFRTTWSLSEREAELSKYHNLLTDVVAQNTLLKQALQSSYQLATCIEAHCLAFQAQHAMWYKIRSKLAKIPYLRQLWRWVANIQSSVTKI